MKIKQIIIFFLFINVLYSDELQTVIQKLQSSTFQGNLTIETKNRTITGKIYYQHGNIHFKLNDGRIIASNSKNIIVYDPDTRVAGKQDKTMGGGLNWILGYPYKIEGNRAKIEPPNQKPYQKIFIRWDSNYFPVLIQFINDEDTITYKFSNITFLNNISSSLFSYKPPAGSRSVENPLNQKQ